MNEILECKIRPVSIVAHPTVVTGRSCSQYQGKGKKTEKTDQAFAFTFSSYFSSAHANEILHFSLHRAERRVAVNELGIKTHAYCDVHSP